MKAMVALALMLISATAAAQINKCVDKAGKVVGYGNQCPEGSRAEPSAVKSAPPPASAPAAAPAGTPSAAPGTPAAAPQPKTTAEKDADFRKRQMERQEAEAKDAKKTAEAANRKRACDESQAYLKALQARQRITRTDPKTGERAYLSDAEYPGEIAKTQQVVTANCK
jgi:hypothetical protein